jgi:2-dehydropantoate 2-reductase
VPLGRPPCAAGTALRTSTEPAALASVDVCIVAVKSRHTREVAEQLADVLPADCVVLSLQNGIRNVERLRARLRGPVVAGVVEFNAYEDGDCVRQATRGGLFAGRSPARALPRLVELRRAFAVVGERLVLRHDIDAIAAGKLLLNLNNGVCAATGLGIADSIRSRDARWCFAACLREASRCMRSAGVHPARVGALPPKLLAPLLELPDAVVAPLAPRIAAMASRARSSTLNDLERGKPTEIDELNGEVVSLAGSSGSAPCNELVVRLVHRLEEAAAAGAPCPFLSPQALRAAMVAASSAPARNAS